ncbi:hypothetical protein CDD83_1859 [Cordyceps sp. RAO-2017]|nr:hypothetical protein CDD83_1859 [Cordyceps sp. RAO-2017]
MGDSSGKKRKRDGEASRKIKKKVVLDAPPAKATVSSVLRMKLSPPVIATTPGIELPDRLLFRSYQPHEDKRSKAKRSRQDDTQELLLHSSTHDRLEYTARETEPRGAKPTLNHFVGIYDPNTGLVDIMEAKKMVVRGQVRARQEAAAPAETSQVKQSALDRRTDLGQTFGTKKAKKAILEKALNAVSSGNKSGDKAPGELDDATRAILKSVGSITSQMATREELDTAVAQAKPVPKANLAATDPADVYDAETMIGADVLNLVPVREWQEKARRKENIQTASRYVASRITSVAASDETITRLRVLRYMEFMLLFYLSTRSSREGRRLPPREQLREKLQPAPEAVIENLRRRFSDAGTMRKFHVDLLKAYCCACALIVDNLDVDTKDLRDDLRMDDRAMKSYFHEVGVRVKPVSRDGQTATMARLTLPLDFPKQRQMAPRRK